MAVDAEPAPGRLRPGGLSRASASSAAAAGRRRRSRSTTRSDEQLLLHRADRAARRGPARRSTERERVDGLLALLHWVAGVSYFKAALPPRISCESGPPAPAAAALLEALYSEGLGELAYTNRLDALPRPVFPRGEARAVGRAPGRRRSSERLLVPVGGGKDSAVAIEIARRSGAEVSLFSIGNAPPIAPHGRRRAACLT